MILALLLPVAFAVTTDTALRLGRDFGATPEFWIHLQTRYDLDVAERTLRLKIEREIELHAPGRNPVGEGGAGTVDASSLCA